MPGTMYLGEIELAGATKVENTSGVWIDGQYMGYLKELKASKILLLPGEHEIIGRQGGYKDFSQKVVVQPGGKQVIRVALEKDLRVRFPTVTAEVKLSVEPGQNASLRRRSVCGTRGRVRWNWQNTAGRPGAT
jgi:hypothetical protein